MEPEEDFLQNSGPQDCLGEVVYPRLSGASQLPNLAAEHQVSLEGWRQRQRKGGSGADRKECGWGQQRAQGFRRQRGSQNQKEKASQRLGTQEGGCISNDLLKKSLKVVPRGLWVLIFGSVQ